MKDRKLYLILLMAMFCCKISFGQDLISYTDSVNRFRLSVPGWRPIDQDAKSNIRLYLYDSSSAIGCTAQTSLTVKLSKGSKGIAKNKKHVATVAPDSSRGVLMNGASWSVRADSVVCRPGELEHKIPRQYVTIIYGTRRGTITLVGTAEHMPLLLPVFLQMGESIVMW